MNETRWKNSQYPDKLLSNLKEDFVVNVLWFNMVQQNFSYNFKGHATPSRVPLNHVAQVAPPSLLMRRNSSWSVQRLPLPVIGTFMYCNCKPPLTIKCRGGQGPFRLRLLSSSVSNTRLGWRKHVTSSYCPTLSVVNGQRTKLISDQGIASRFATCASQGKRAVHKCE